MNKKQLAYFEKRLMEERARVMKELGYYDESFNATLNPPTAISLPIRFTWPTRERMPWSGKSSFCSPRRKGGICGT
jgi:hypothetical protein